METNHLIAAYTKNPVGNKKPATFVTTCTQENSLCGDDITVYLDIDEQGIIRDFGYDGHPAMFTITAASLLSEVLLEKKTPYQELLGRGNREIEALGFIVSMRRQRSAVTALLACRNALHQRLGDGKIDTYDDMFR